MLKNVTLFGRNSNGKQSWRLLDPDGRPVPAFDVYAKTLERQPVNTRKNYLRWLAEFFDYLFEVGAWCANGEAISQEALIATIEAYDDYLVLGAESGNPVAQRSLGFLMRSIRWSDPLPSRAEDPAFDRIRRSLDASDTRWQFNPESLEKLSPAIRRVQLQNGLLPNYGERFNPLLRCIVRRTRAYLEATINPATGGYLLPKVTVKLFGEEEQGALVLGDYLREAYQEAERFSLLLQQRVKGAGFFKTLLLRRLGSSMEAGRRTISKLLGGEPDVLEDEEDDDPEEDTAPQVGRPPQGVSDFKDFTDDEPTSLERCLELLREGGNNDPKLDALIGYLRGTYPGVTQGWLDLGCILFSQYYDTVRWIGDEMAKRAEFSGMDIGLYSGSNRSGLWRDGKFQRCDRNVLKDRVRSGDLKLLLGTDAASEGLNLQRLGTLINIDLPWNPTRLEQRKGRIQRIGQARSEIWIANLRYRDSVKDRVHQVLADRLEAIHGLFGQIPDTLEDVWVQVALNDEQTANKLIDRTTATRNPFDAKYSKVEDADWETCASVLNGFSMKELLSRGW